MIQSKQQLRAALQKEAELYHKKWYYRFPVNLAEQQILYKHGRYLRKAEYAYNCNRRFLHKWYLFRLLRIQMRHGICIPLNVVEEGFQIVHLGAVLINAKAHIGKNCRVHPGVCIGANHDKAPKIGDHVYIGPGAKVFGDIVLADRIQVGANAVVTKSCLREGAVLVGVPAREVGEEQDHENIVSS